MTQKSCAVGMRNAKLGNHLNLPVALKKFSDPHFSLSNFDWHIKICHLICWPFGFCTSQIEASMSLLRAFEFLDIFLVQIPHSPGQKAVEMPHHRSISGNQMPPPPGKLSDYCSHKCIEIFINMTSINCTMRCRYCIELLFKIIYLFSIYHTSE